MLREEVEQYTNLTGEDGWHVPIMKLGAYLDGYNKGLEVLDEIRAEIEHIGGDDEKAFCKNLNEFYKQGLKDALKVIEKYKAERR